MLDKLRRRQVNLGSTGIEEVGAGRAVMYCSAANFSLNFDDCKSGLVLSFVVVFRGSQRISFDKM